MRHIGKVIARSLVARNWSQSDLARASGLSRSTISAICNGRRGRNIGAATLAKIADALGVDVAFFGLQNPHMGGIDLHMRGADE